MVRLRAFEFLEAQTRLHGDVLLKRVLERGFDYQGQRVPLIAPQGIFTPKACALPLSICTAPPNLRKPRPYDDELGEDGIIRYRYRGTDPHHRDNVGLRTAMQQGTPLVYLFGVVPGEYCPVWPVYICGDNPASLTFQMAVDDKRQIDQPQWIIKDAAEPKRQYITVETQRRLHQRSFRERVLRAYMERCAICRLQHPELLEASHILPDGHPLGEPIIPNGLALCKLHHAAFDLNIIGIRPDHVVEVREDILKEHDGPMLRHGIQEVQGQKIWVPRPPSSNVQTQAGLP
jgi:putative restriction endonuclease